METLAYALQNDAWYKVLADGGTVMWSVASGGVRLHTSSSDTDPGAAAAHHYLEPREMNGLNVLASFPTGTRVWIKAATDDQAVIITRTAQA